MTGPLLHQQRVGLDLALSGVLASQRGRSPETVGEPSRCAERNGVGMPVGLGLDVCGAEVLPEIHHRVLRLQQAAAGGVPYASVVGNKKILVKKVFYKTLYFFDLLPSLQALFLYFL